jgi:hypothetical protein
MTEMKTLTAISMWAIVWPNGRCVTGDDFQDEDRAWQIALGWPGPDEIEHAKNHEGARAVRGQFIFSQDHPPKEPSHGSEHAR